MKIFAIGLNYDSHNKEMKRTFESKEPVLFMKPDTALLKDGKPFMLPDFSNEIHYETELVVKINRLGKNIAERFAHRYYDEITVGIDFTARDIQRKQKELDYHGRLQRVLITQLQLVSSYPRVKWMIFRISIFILI